MKTHAIKTGGLLLLLLFCGLWGNAQLIVTPTITPACHAQDAAVTFSISGGQGTNYSYQLTELYPTYNNSSAGQLSPTFTNLVPGIYNIYVYSSLDSTNLEFTITNTLLFTPTITNTTCPANTGSIAVSTAGGTAPYHYVWGNGATTTSISNLAGGGYNLTVTDASGCSAVTADTVEATSAMSATITSNNIICNPTLTASQTGGVTPVSYRWSTGATTASITGLSNYGNYWVSVTDANGCTAFNSLTVYTTNLSVDSSHLTNIVYPSCTNTTGSISIVMNNGTAPYTYAWSNGATTAAISGLVINQYSVTVTDAHGCTGTQTFNLAYQNTVNAEINSAFNPNCGESTGILGVLATENTGSNVFTYAWSNGASSASLTNIPQGVYTVTVTDNSGCSATVSYNLQGIPGFHVTITTTPTACNSTLPNGTATAVVTGTGVAPYSFAWYDATTWPPTLYSTNQTITNLPYGGGYTVQVTDASGCGPVAGLDSIYIRYEPSCYDHITGYAYNDANANCTFDAHETGAVAATIVATNAAGTGSYYATPDTTGFYDLEVLPGIYNVNSYIYAGSACSSNSCMRSYTDTFTAVGQISANNNFAATSGVATYNLGVHMGYEGSAPGLIRKYWVYYYNWGLTPVTNGVLTFVHDANITLTTTTPPYTSYDAATRTITWDITNNLAPMSWLDANHQVVMFFDIPATLALGTQLTALATISPVVNDCDPSDNTQALTDLVSASHDPNAKEVSPAGNLTAADSVLTYTIRFQNTGNAPATLVIIKDTLSANVDPATIIAGASSSPYTYKLSNNGILTFTFEPIYLIDSATNADSSKGFVTYTVHTKKNLPIGAQVKNTAYIYFDANPAVVTNTTNNLRSDFATGITKISNSAMQAQVFPNPASDNTRIAFEGATGNIELKITDALGNLIATSKSTEDHYLFNVEKLAQGIYFYTAVDANNNRASGKILVVK